MFNAQKTPIVKSLSRHTLARVADAMAIHGKSLPASVVAVKQATVGSGIVPIVTVKFELTQANAPTLPQVTCVVASSAYVREPIQVGDKGYVEPADAYLGAMSGLGGGTADYTRRGNLATLVWHPLGNTGFTGTDANAVEIAGPHGAKIHPLGSMSPIINVGTNAITLAVGANNIIIDSAGIHVHGSLTVDGGTIIVNGTVLTVP